MLRPSSRPASSVVARGILRTTLLCTTFVLGSLLWPAWSQEAGTQGLKGLLPEALPESYSNVLSNLPESWKEWGEGLAGDLGGFYAETPVDIAGQRAAIAKFRVKLNTLEKAVDDPQYATIVGTLRTLKGGLERRLAVWETALDLMEGNSAEAKAAAAKLVKGAEQFEATSSKGGATLVREAFDELRKSAPEAAAKLEDLLRKNYFNYNLHAYVTEGFLNRAFMSQHTEQGGVVDFILGADVTGCQITNSTAGFDLQPMDNGVRFYITLQGNVTANTEGVTRQATVYTNSNHAFYATKEVTFDGENFSTQPAGINVYPNNQPQKAVTRASGIPIFGGLTETIAMNSAMSKRPQTEAIAVERVQSRLLPRFNSEVEEHFSKSGGDLKAKVKQPMEELGVYPDVRVFRSTDSSVEIHTRLMGAGELAANKPAVSNVPDGQMLVNVHESLVNGFLDRLQIAGKTMTEDELRVLLEEKFTKLFGRKIEIPAAKKGEEDANAPKAMIFAEADPIRVRFSNGQATLILRAGFKRSEGGDIPTQIVSVPLNATLTAAGIEIARKGDVAVEPVQAPENVAEQIARAGVIKKKLQNAIEDKVHSPIIHIDRDEEDQPDAEVKVIGLDLQDGWLTVIAE